MGSTARHWWHSEVGGFGGQGVGMFWKARQAGGGAGHGESRAASLAGPGSGPPPCTSRPVCLCSSGCLHCALPWHQGAPSGPNPRKPPSNILSIPQPPPPRLRAGEGGAASSSAFISACPAPHPHPRPPTPGLYVARASESCWRLGGSPAAGMTLGKCCPPCAHRVSPAGPSPRTGQVGSTIFTSPSQARGASS